MKELGGIISRALVFLVLAVIIPSAACIHVSMASEVIDLCNDKSVGWIWMFAIVAAMIISLITFIVTSNHPEEGVAYIILSVLSIGGLSDGGLMKMITNEGYWASNFLASLTGLMVLLLANLLAIVAFVKQNPLVMIVTIVMGGFIGYIYWP